MRIGIDATPLLLRSAGVKNYTYHLLKHLRAIAGEDAIRAFPYVGRFGELDHEHSVLGFFPTYLRLALLYFVNVPGNPALTGITSGLDVLHASNQLRNRPGKVKVTATVHDMTCWLSPEMHTAANVRADRNFADVFLREADGLIAVSGSTRDDLVRILRVPEQRVRVIYPGIAPAFFSPSPSGVADRLRLTKPFVLYIGTIEPRKNIDKLLAAWAGLAEDLRHSHELVLAGSVGWASEGTVARLGVAPGVRYLGYVPEPDLPGLTASAKAFVYPSLYEGFGFPVAQAMAAGVPVITSNLSSLPEITGGAALLIDPRSEIELTRALERVLTGQETRQALAAGGRERAERFRWESCARESLEFFHEVSGRAAR